MLDLLEALEGERQVRAALVTCQGMDLVDYHGPHVAEDRPGAPGGDEQVKALGGGDQEGRRLAQHRASRTGGGVSGAHRHCDGRHRQAQLASDLCNLCERSLEVLVDVDSKGLQG